MHSISRIFSAVLRRSYATESSQAVTSIFANEGIDPEVIRKLLEANPELQNYPADTIKSSIDLFRNQGFTTDSYLRIINKHPRILTTNPAMLCNNLEIWRASQFGERYVQILVTEHPHLLDMKVDKYAEQKIMERLQYLKDYVQTKKNVWRLLCCSPNVVVDKLADVEEKRTFFEEVMKVEHTEVAKTTAFSHTMHKIKMRHEFLTRLGVYKPKNPKADPTLKSTNPSLYQILDTTDKRFATKVALVSMEEFEVFQDVFKREEDRKAGVYERRDGDEEDKNTYGEEYSSDEDEDEERRNGYKKR